MAVAESTKLWLNYWKYMYNEGGKNYLLQIVVARIVLTEVFVANS